MKKYLKFLIPIVIVIVICVSIHKINIARAKVIKKFDKEYSESKKSMKKTLNEATEDTFDESLEIPRTESQYEQIGLIEEEHIVEEKVEEIVKEPEVVSDSYTTRMTSFWANDGYGTGECTGSGKCSWDFGVNDKGWYTYQGKLVVATATTYLANQGWYVAEGVHLYKYYEELVLTIDGVEYDAIILDSCGSSMKTDRVDLFVSNGSSARDTTINVRRK